MGLFSFIETFFFVSLAVTFILILLLVYHFRQRFNTLEQKCDTMFELINSVVSEMNAMRSVQSGVPNMMFHPDHQGNTHYEQVDGNISHYLQDEHQHESDDDSGSEEDSDDESGTEEDSDDESGTEEDSDDESGTEEEIPDDASVKVIVLENQENEGLTLVPDDTVDASDNENVDDIIQPEDFSEADPVVVEKLNDEYLENTITAEPNSIEEIATDVYRKMTIQNLKALVITKGLCSDPSKMKKAELLKMLNGEANE
jgi:hypothetical protein